MSQPLPEVSGQWGPCWAGDHLDHFARVGSCEVYCVQGYGYDVHHADEVILVDDCFDFRWRQVYSRLYDGHHCDHEAYAALHLAWLPVEVSYETHDEPCENYAPVDGSLDVQFAEADWFAGDLCHVHVAED